MPGRPAVGDVHQQQLGAGQPASRSMCCRTARSAAEFSMATRILVYIAIPHDATNVCQSSQTFSAAMTTATGQASASIQRGATSGPILLRSAGEHHQRKHRERQLQAQHRPG